MWYVEQRSVGSAWSVVTVVQIIASITVTYPEQHNYTSSCGAIQPTNDPHSVVNHHQSALTPYQCTW